jgi:antitoxin (DNA-binding transcriptional repressor) of toxin-antitoxin stability system
MKLTLDEYSKYFKMSKEMIRSKLRTKKLNCVVENGTTYIISDNNHQKKDKKETIPKMITKPKTTVATIIALYQRENNQLKEKITQLENKIDKLIDDKEQMLRDERDKIESLYTSKDKQLRNILELINTKLALEQKTQTIHEVEPLEPQKEEADRKQETPIVELREYLKTLSLKPHQRKVIKKRFLASYNRDIRIIKQNGKLYLDFSKYDYSDLLDY